MRPYASSPTRPVMRTETITSLHSSRGGCREADAADQAAEPTSLILTAGAVDLRAN